MFGIEPARAHDKLLLHTQQKFAGQQSGFERADLPVGGQEHFHPPSPGMLPQIIRRQYPTRQQRVVDHRVQPRLALGRAPAQQRLRRRAVPQRVTRSLFENFQMPDIAAVDALEVPRAQTLGWM